MRYLYATMLLGAGLTSLSHAQVLEPYNTPVGSPVLIHEASGDALYGTCSDGGTYIDGLSVLHILYGCVWKYDLSTSTFSVILPFTGLNGGTPVGRLIASQSGGATYLYGTTAGLGTDLAGMPTGQGTAFRIRTDGANFKTLKAFTSGMSGYPETSGYPEAGLVEDPVAATNGSHVFYGTNSEGGNGGSGAVYRLVVADTDTANPTTTFSRIRNFNSATQDPITGLYTNIGGKKPLCDLLVAYVDGSDGLKRFIYGTTSQAGPSSGGTVFRLESLASSPPESATHTNRNLKNFDAVTGYGVPFCPASGLVLHTDPSSQGWLYGTTTLTTGAVNSHGPGAIYKIALQYGTSSGYTTLRSYDLAGDTNSAVRTQLDGKTITCMAGFQPTAALCPVMVSGVPYFMEPDSYTYHYYYSWPPGASVATGNVVRLTLAGGLDPAAVMRDGELLTSTDYPKYTGTFPTSALINGGSYLYGVAPSGGTNGLGTIYKVNMSTYNITAVYHF